MSKESTAKVRQARQWVTLRQGSLDVRLGSEALSKLGHELKSSVGKPRLCVLVFQKSLKRASREQLRREIVNEGFDLRELELELDDKRATLAAAERLMEEFAKLELTSDDVCCAVGNAELLDTVAFACTHWYAGVVLAAVATDMLAALSTITPLALDLPFAKEALTHTSCPKLVFADPDFLEFYTSSETTKQLFCHFVASAVAENERAFEQLWDRADAIMEGDTQALFDQLSNSMRGRGRTVYSSSIAVRQSVAFGLDLIDALREVAPKKTPTSTLFAEALRFSSRLAVAEADFDIDDMYAIDELLELFGLPELSANIKADKFVESIKAERFKRNNRLMLLLPQALGRVRLTAVPEEILTEHAEAWCASRKRS